MQITVAPRRSETIYNFLRRSHGDEGERALDVNPSSPTVLYDAVRAIRAESAVRGKAKG